MCGTLSDSSGVFLELQTFCWRLRWVETRVPIPFAKSLWTGKEQRNLQWRMLKLLSPIIFWRQRWKASLISKVPKWLKWEHNNREKWYPDFLFPFQRASLCPNNSICCHFESSPLVKEIEGGARKSPSQTWRWGIQVAEPAKYLHLIGAHSGVGDCSIHSKM